MRILVISDTHIPRAAQDLPDVIYKEIETADMIVHAGDFAEKYLFDKLIFRNWLNNNLMEALD